MIDPSIDRYYVRIRGRVQGPFDLARLKVLRARGQFSRVFEVSQDRRTWTGSEGLSQLLEPFVPDAVLAEAEPNRQPAAGRSDSHLMNMTGPDDGTGDWQPRRERRSEGRLATVLLILALIVIPAAVVGGIVLMQRLKDQSAEPQEAPPVEEETPAVASLPFSGSDWSRTVNF